jgi:hypothetical protein
MLPHEHEEYQQQMGHVWLGFSPSQISRYLTHAGFENPRITPLPRDTDARGPELFAATAVRCAEPARGETDLPLTSTQTTSKEQP